MTANELIQALANATNLLSSGSIPVRMNGKEFDVDVVLKVDNEYFIELIPKEDDYNNKDL